MSKDFVACVISLLEKFIANFGYHCLRVPFTFLHAGRQIDAGQGICLALGGKMHAGVWMVLLDQLLFLLFSRGIWNFIFYFLPEEMASKKYEWKTKSVTNIFFVFYGYMFYITLLFPYHKLTFNTEL